jgi:hypothetical protein
VSNSRNVLQLTKYFISTLQAKALVAWGLATPLDGTESGGID